MIRSKRSLALWPLLLTLIEPAFALQLLEARDGDTVLASISRQDVTRIAFEHGRIRKVTGNAGDFVLEKDEDQGHIFIRPTSPESSKPINLFVSSERNTVALLLQPVDTPSDTILIREVGEQRKEVQGRGTSTAHVRALKNLLLVMADDVLPPSMDVREESRELKLWPGTELTLQRSWRNSRAIGEKYLVVNVGSVALNLSERDLYKRGVMAISVEQPALLPGEATHFFLIRERSAHE